MWIILEVHSCRSINYSVLRSRWIILEVHGCSSVNYSVLKFMWIILEVLSCRSINYSVLRSRYFSILELGPDIRIIVMMKYTSWSDSRCPWSFINTFQENLIFLGGAAGVCGGIWFILAYFNLMVPIGFLKKFSKFGPAASPAIANLKIYMS